MRMKQLRFPSLSGTRDDDTFVTSGRLKIFVLFFYVIKKIVKQMDMLCVNVFTQASLDYAKIFFLFPLMSMYTGG